ncbi:MAG: hypothetical protein ACKV1O_28305 [Saprospiraceae bacterium]
MSNQEFLFTLISILVGIAITQLLKGQTLLLKDYFHQSKQKNIGKRWWWRLLWSVNLVLLIVQYIWGFRLEIDKITEFWKFIYFLTIPALIYGTVNYMFPDNVENLYKDEENEKDEEKKEKIFLRRINLFYCLFLAWIISTIPMNFSIRKDKKVALINAEKIMEKYKSANCNDTLKMNDLPINFTIKSLNQLGLNNAAIKYLKTEQTDLDKIDSKNIRVLEVVVERSALDRKIEKLRQNDFETIMGFLLKSVCIILLAVAWFIKSKNKEKAALINIDFAVVIFSILMILYYFIIRIE